MSNRLGLGPELLPIDQAFGGYGEGAIFASLYQDGDTFHSAALSVSGVTITGALFTDQDTFEASELTGGEVGITGALFTDPDTFGTAVTTLYLVGALYNDTEAFFTSTVVLGTQQVSGSLFTNLGTFHGATIEGGFSLPGDVATDFFETQGATQPWYAQSTQYSAAYYNGKTYVAWEGYERTDDNRFCQIRAYTHSTGQWGRVYTVGKYCNTQDDDHGVPAICFNADGRATVVYGDHDGNLHVSTMTNAEDESHWTFIAEGAIGRYTYPHMLLIGTTVYLTLRKDIPPGVEFSSGAKILVYRPITYSGATATVGNEVIIGDLGNNSRWYQGNHALVSGRMAQVCARADYNDVYRRHTYYYEIDFSGAQLVAFDGTTAAFPVSSATMDSTFRIHETIGSTSEQSIPQMLVSGSTTHIVFHEGVTDGDAPDVKHITGSSGSFGSASTVFTHTNSDVKRDGPAIIQGASDIAMYYSVDPDALYLRGGNIARRKWNGSSWGSEESVMLHDSSRWPLGQIGVVFNAHADARVIFTEAIGLAAASGTDADSFPYKRGFVLGDSGFLPAEQPTASAPDSWSGEGVWYDPSDITSLWANSGRTIQATVDNAVAVMDDKSGNGHHLPSVGTDPVILRLDNGIYWLEFGDKHSPTSRMDLADVAMVASNAYWVCGGARNCNHSTGSTSHNMVNVDEGSGADRVFSIARVNNSSSGEGQLQTVPFSNTGSGASQSTPTNTIRSNDDFVYGLHVNGTAATHYWNGAQFGTSTVGSVPDTGLSRLRLGSNATDSSSTRKQGRFYGLIIRAGNIDTTTRAEDMAYIRSKMPL